ncbi:hypothetical protein Pmani_006713 [Petrolisthes manimaculis]|uniref:Uncharacterized protein n=1 Tax=Petrolisthes manimaculis TaxID=1843537 RepID=A0AAE1UG79_9EUCA|nr:hypothetical protein Pmani_006713 [Petrolisthes manimaculis]
MGVRNQEGESMVDFAVAFDKAILNTFFTKSSYRTYRNGPRESQIDFLLYRRDNIREVEDCKVLQGESVGAQHSPGEVWRSMRSKGVKEKYVKVVQDMYREAMTKVKSIVGITESFPLRVGLHQGSGLCHGSAVSIT